MRPGLLARCASGLAFALTAIALVAPRARAHDQSFSYANLDWGHDRIAIRLSVHRDDAATALQIAEPESLMQAPFLARHVGRLASILLPGLIVQGDGRELALALQGAAARPERRAVELKLGTTLARPVGRLHVAAKLLPWNPQHETFLNVYAGSRLVREAVLTADDPAVDVYAGGAAGVLAVLRTFVAAGIHHIFIGPDHILFVIGLLLLGGGLRRLIKVITMFTVAHSITLALAALGLVNIPGRVVEPLIALSIVYLGFENLRSHPGGRDWRTRIAFGFGLVHGLGFASVLREFGLPREALGWSLLAFNLGVEIGQACIVLAVTPLLAGLRAGLPRMAPRAIAAGSWGIVVAGGYWFVQRVSGTG
ncbi:MAG: HupE/UreJ family protein [Candidatus Eisenbacteria bacterium]|uniref:HupE/UreJ family protein n=1 Tax=Eiseniibacteriota bacterium TaxID=2212470 RepID=A0A538TGT2_UNCEI|nr:MAG: HupE/UreJ family protein [Candidatus Eisenbacteria bacterium]